MKDKIRIGLIGAGAWGKNHLRVLNELGLLAAVADTDTTRRDEITKNMPHVQVSNNYHELLSSPDIDAICVATPASSHAAIAADCLNAGKHVFVEKPLTLTSREGKILVDLAHEKEKILMVGHLLHYHPAIIALKKIVQEGLLGKLRYIAAHRLNTGRIRTEENVMWSFAPHDISLIMSFFGEAPMSIRVSSNAFITPTIADIGITTLAFTENRGAHIYTSWLHAHKERQFTIIGEKATAVFDDLAQDKVVLYETPVIFDSKGIPTISCTNKTAISLPNEEPLANEWRHFVECVVTGAKPMTDGAEGVAVLSVLEQV